MLKCIISWNFCMKKTVSIFGVTGSIGESCVDVILSYREKFEIIGITAYRNVDTLIEVAKKIQPKYVVLWDESLFGRLQKWLEWEKMILLSGKQGLDEIASIRCDIFVSAIVWIAWLSPTYHAIQAWSDIWLANKESLVCAWDMIMNLAKQKWVSILPIDSEHNALFQCIANNKQSDIQKVVLTASGGPFRNKTKQELQSVTKAMALKHPNWSMWQKISIDSATMINKWLEVIEAYHLFDITPNQIDIIVHPESIIHGMVTYKDGNTLAAMSMPDMRVPIACVLWFPEKLDIQTKPLDLIHLSSLHFEAPNLEIFEWLKICLEILQKNPSLWCVLNAANEVAVEAFLQEKIPFLDIIEIIKATLKQAKVKEFRILEDVFESDREARILASRFIQQQEK